MNNLFERANKMIPLISGNSITKENKINDVLFVNCGYKENNDFPKPSNMKKSDGNWIIHKDSHTWFRFEIDVDEVANQYCELKIRTTPYVRKNVGAFWVGTGDNEGWDSINPQLLVYVDGIMTQSFDVNHMSTLVKPGHHEIYVYAYSGGDEADHLVFEPSLIYIQKDVERLYYDLEVARSVLEFTKPLEKIYFDIETFLNNAINEIDFTKQNCVEFYENCRVVADKFEKEFYQDYCGQHGDHYIVTNCIGHTHIDIAWMWTVAQTREKAQRSFSTVLALMDKYPEYKFMSSQAYLYDACKKECPELFKRIQERVKEGRWEVEGAMWVEADCNLSSGESLVRQVLVGKQFFKKNFNVDSKILWLPDVFGYSASLPQILQKSGVNKFVTSKISWNDTNLMPYDIFTWRGIDGTDIFSYYLTAQDIRIDREINRGCAYNAVGTARYVAGTYHRLQQKELTNEAIITYGYGDGGGGPTKHDIERIKRLQNGIPTIPTTRFEFAGTFLNRLEEQIKDKKVPLWSGELYLEYHRGTYTSIAKNKKNNRRSEFLMSNLEYLSVMDQIKNNIAPRKDWMDDEWKMILTNQFHDIIPGSAIKEVYDVTDIEYAKFFNEGKSYQDEMLNNLTKDYKGTVVFNPTPFKQNGYIDVDNKKYFVKDIPSKGFKSVTLNNINKVIIKDKLLENDYLRISFNDRYEIVSIFDKENNREILKDKAMIKGYEDYAHMFEAWELRNYYREKELPLDFIKVEQIDNGGEKGFKVTRKLAESLIYETISLYDELDTLNFNVELDWKNKNLMLKSTFPLDINSLVATCDIQFGKVERPTVENTSWDQAKFEVCAHKYVDISEGNYGVSLINDCKYGHSLTDNVIGLTLIKCTTYPNEGTDIGHHEMSFILSPHKGNFTQSDTVKKAYLLNNPFIVKEGKGNKEISYSFISSDMDNVVIDTIKPSEDKNGYIVRMYETMNSTSNVTLTFAEKVNKAYFTNLMEENINEIEVKDNKISLTIKPFEIVTLRIK